VNYQNLQSDTGTDIPQYAGSCEKTLGNGESKTSLFLDVTGAVKKFFVKGRPGRIGLVGNNEVAISWETLNLALYVKA
jgi:hypothetical protein